MSENYQFYIKRSKNIPLSRYRKDFFLKCPNGNVQQKKSKTYKVQSKEVRNKKSKNNFIFRMVWFIDVCKTLQMQVVTHIFYKFQLQAVIYGFFAWKYLSDDVSLSRLNSSTGNWFTFLPKLSSRKTGLGHYSERGKFGTGYFWTGIIQIREISEQ